VVSAKTANRDIALQGIPILNLSPGYLDFKFDLNTLDFCIENIGKGDLTYTLFVENDWISINHTSGKVKDQPYTITVTVDRTGLSDTKQKGLIEILWDEGKEPFYIYMNGLMDIDTNYYNIVNIEAGGQTQTWMAENLKVTRNPGGDEISSYYYNNDTSNLRIYGRLYRNSQALNDELTTPKTQGICPDGWHIPDSIEFSHLVDNFTRDDLLVGGSSGFNGLYGGFWYFLPSEYLDLGKQGGWWTSSSRREDLGWVIYFYISFTEPFLEVKGRQWLYSVGNVEMYALSVRCIKDTAMVK